MPSVHVDHQRNAEQEEETFGSRHGSWSAESTVDPSLYVDGNQANENIKNLLDGTLQDEDRKVRMGEEQLKVREVMVKHEVISPPRVRSSLRTPKHIPTSTDLDTLDGTAVRLGPPS